MKKFVVILVLLSFLAFSLSAQQNNNMVFIQGGTFMMGSPEDEPERFDDEGQHEVIVSSFYMGKYPVTQEEYLEVMGTNLSRFKGDNLPVEVVSWYDAIIFCNKLSMKEGLTPAYRINNSTDPVQWGTVPMTYYNPAWDAVQIVPNSTGYRLPTEAEWEYACRAGTTTAFNTGNNLTKNQANYNGNRTTPVGSFAPNQWGLYDMHGNVWEWCWDWYGEYSQDTGWDEKPSLEPTEPAAGTNRVMRGGTWGSVAQYLRSAFREYSRLYDVDSNLGFRVVRNAVQQDIDDMYD